MEETTKKCPSKPKTLTRPELFKLYLAIDQETVKDAIATNRSLEGLSGPADLQEVNEILQQAIDEDVTDEDIRLLADQDLEGEGLGGLFKKFRRKIKKAAKKVGKFVGKVVKKAAKFALKVVTFPLRLALTLALKILKGPAAKAFVYTFIPPDSPVLKSNPEVARKRKRQEKALRTVKNVARFKRSYLNKLIRNAVKKQYGKTPEQVIHDISQGKDKGFQGLGIAPLLVAPLVASLVKLIPGFKKEDMPKSLDFVNQVASNLNVTGDPEYDARAGKDFSIIMKNNPPQVNNGADGNNGDDDENAFTKFITSPAGIAVAVGSVVVIGGAAIFLSKN